MRIQSGQKNSVKTNSHADKLFRQVPLSSSEWGLTECVAYAFSPFAFLPGHKYMVSRLEIARFFSLMGVLGSPSTGGSQRLQQSCTSRQQLEENTWSGVWLSAAGGASLQMFLRLGSSFVMRCFSSFPASLFLILQVKQGGIGMSASYYTANKSNETAKVPIFFKLQ